MVKLKAAAQFETALDTYTVTEMLGEGGAGRVYGGVASDGTLVAVKLLANDKITADKRRRFKNEIAFLAKNTHPNVVSVVDQGAARTGSLQGPFYVMPRYDGNLCGLIAAGIGSADVLALFGQILDGVEAAHLQGVVHRDLKPENVLKGDQGLAVADFGIASFTDDVLATLVETDPTQRLANFVYAAPEQRTPGGPHTPATDIWALGLILNEMFTGAVPHGTGYRTIETVTKEYGFLDPIVAEMLRQNPAERPASISALKSAIQKFRFEAVTQQRLSQIDATVIKIGTVDDPLAFDPPKLVDAQWDKDVLTLTLDRSVNRPWVNALHNMGNYSSIVGLEPHMFNFIGATAKVSVRGGDAQHAINHLKQWLPQATVTYRRALENEARVKEQQERDRLQRERVAAEHKLKVNQSLKV